MDNTKKIVKSSGIMGKILEEDDLTPVHSLYNSVLKTNRETHQPFRPEEEENVSNRRVTSTFKENEIIKINPKECEPWEYANRSFEEMGDIEELMKSIQERGQLQPVMIISHPNPNLGIKYQVIFGRRRHEACLRLGIPLTAIKKDNIDVQKAILFQDAENRHRKNVSNYSNALLYKKLIRDGIFKNENELASKLEMAQKTLNDIMAFSKLPEDIVKAIPNIHTISTIIAVKIVTMINKDKENHLRILAIAPRIGITITSADKLEKTIFLRSIERTNSVEPKYIKAKDGRRLFTVKPTDKGGAKIILHDEFGKQVDYEHFCNYLKNYSVAKIYEPS